MEWSSIYPFLAVALGGAIGATLRYTISRTVDTEFPWATFIVNIVGCTLAAFLMFKFAATMDNTVYVMIFVGIFGAFTTMSTFSIDTVKLLVDQQFMNAFINFILNTVVCVAGAFIGRYLALL